jgi:hypothetical protein
LSVINGPSVACGDGVSPAMPIQDLACERVFALDQRGAKRGGDGEGVQTGRRQRSRRGAGGFRRRLGRRRLGREPHQEALVVEPRDVEALTPAKFRALADLTVARRDPQQAGGRGERGALQPAVGADEVAPGAVGRLDRAVVGDDRAGLGQGADHGLEVRRRGDRRGAPAEDGEGDGRDHGQGPEQSETRPAVRSAAQGRRGREQRRQKEQPRGGWDQPARGAAHSHVLAARRIGHRLSSEPQLRLAVDSGPNQGRKFN